MKLLSHAICLLLFVAGTVIAAVPPEIPILRTTQVFAPFRFQFDDMGEDTFIYGGPDLLKYSVQSFVQIDDPILNVKPITTLPKFVNFLQSPASILSFHSHHENGWLAVEPYPGSLDGKAEALSAKEFYKLEFNANDSEINIDDVGVNIWGDPIYWAVVVSTGFIKRIISNHPIVVGIACNSYDLRNAFINESHKVRDYIGVQGLIYGDGLFNIADGKQIIEAIFENMSGRRNDSGEYRNMPLSATIPFANIAVPEVTTSYTPDNVLPLAGNMRLYNAPRIVIT